MDMEDEHEAVVHSYSASVDLTSAAHTPGEQMFNTAAHSVTIPMKWA